MNYLKLIVIFFTFLLLNEISFSQPQREWVSQFNSGGSENEIVSDLKTDKEGNIYLCGSVQYTSSLKDALLLKYNSSGVLLWSRTWRGTGVNVNESVGKKILFDSEGFIYVMGTASITTNLLDFLLIKYAPNGDTVWARTFDGMNNNSDEATDITIDQNDNIYITGILYKFSNTDIGVVKYDKYGSLKWYRIFLGINDNYAGSGQILNDSHYIFVVGGSFKDSINFFDITILKYDTMGVPLDTFYYGSKIREGAGLLAFDTKKNLIIGGGENPGLPTRNNIVTMKINQSGEEIWYEIFNNNFDNFKEILYDMKTDNEGNPIVAARSRNTQTNRGEIALIKYDNISGDSIWSRKFNLVPFSTDEPSKFSVDKDNNIYVIGSTDSNFIFNRILILKYNPSGQLQWHLVYHPSVFSVSNGAVILTDTLGNIYACGTATTKQTGDDIVLIKYSTMTEVYQVNTNIPEVYCLYQNYPNPFNSQTEIKFDLIKSGHYKIEVFDMLGRSVAILFNEFKNAGSYIIKFNASDLSSGVYFYKLSSPEVNIIKKFTLVK
ncbi:MAG: SBBP repeat-containing protein [Ignavibacteria bacterium]|nr:SBBP repeat-containing protein [Ignavibacteria bacterium]